jgi:hypothetical protein
MQMSRNSRPLIHPEHHDTNAWRHLMPPRHHKRHHFRVAPTSRYDDALPTELAGALSLGEASTETDPWLRAIHPLHIGARPDALPCHAEEYARVMHAVEDLRRVAMDVSVRLLLVSGKVRSPAQTFLGSREQAKQRPCKLW